MGRWAQNRMRGSGLPPAAPSFVLTASSTLEDELDWDWHGPDPDHWRIEESNPPGEHFVFFDTAPAADRIYHGIGGGALYRLVGVDALDVPVTPYSNSTGI